VIAAACPRGKVKKRQARPQGAGGKVAQGFAHALAPKQRQQDHDRQRHAEHPQKQTSTHSHRQLLSEIEMLIAR